jgi:GH35 family endo-1,4-beta-xylanase
MKHILTVLIVITLLVACVPTPSPALTATPLPAATSLPSATSLPTSTPTNTPVPTATFTPTATPMPAIPPEKVGGLTNIPELEQVAVAKQAAKAAIERYAKAIGVHPETVKLTARALKDYKGNLFAVAVTDDGTPLLIASPNAQGKIEWRAIGLRDLANANGIDIGTLIGQWNTRFPNEFNTGTATYPWSFSPTQNVQDTNWRLGIANNAKMKNLTMQAVVFTQEFPKDIQSGNLSREAMTKILQDRVKDVLTTYKGKISRYVIVNEPYFPPLRDDILWRTIGPEYIDLAFQAARDADPNAVLIFNDPQNHTSGGLLTKQTQDIVSRLKPKGLIDGVGLQMHIMQYSNQTLPQKQDMVNTMRGYGLPVYITEFDINLTWISGTKEEKYRKQADIAKDVVGACVESGVCKSITFWGFTDAQSWLKNKDLRNTGGSENADPLPIGDNDQPKPFYYAVLQAFAEYLNH